MAENLNVSQFDTRAQANSELWRYGIEDLDRLPFGGSGVWKSVGPAPLIVTSAQLIEGIGPNSGEVVDIAIDPTGGADATIYIATNNGGVWKSTTSGRSWQPLTDFLPSSAIGAVAIDPGDPNIVYAGTGNLFDGATGLPKATGLFKSLNGGISWAHMDGGLLASVFADHGINRIVCPAPGALLVAADNGLFFSKNGGVTFGNNHPDYDDSQPVRGGNISALIPDTNSITQQPVTDVTGPGPVVITSRGHGFKTDDRVFISGVVPSRFANGSWIIDRIDDDTFTLRGSVEPGIGATSGVVMGPAHPRTLNVQAADRVAPGNLIVIRSDAHGLLTGDYVAIHGVGGNTNANRSWQVHVRDADHFDLIGSSGNAAYTGGGIIDAPRHRAPQAITAAVNQGANIRITVPGHGFVTGDQVTLNGLPGVNAPNNDVFVNFVDADNFRIGGRQLNAAYAGGGTVAGPAAAWNSAFFVSAGPAGANRGLFRVTLCSDGGLVLSDNLLAHAGGPAAGGGIFGRVAVTQSFLPRPRTLYISVQNGNNFLGFFHSDNYGRTWTRRFALDARLVADGTGQSDYDFTIGVDPQDSTRVYAALQRLWRSTNSGINFDPVDPATGFGADAPVLNGGIDLTVHSPSACMIHVDHHAMAFDPPTLWVARAPLTTTMYFGTDGGISRSDDGAVTYVSLNEGLNTALLLDIDIGRGNPGNQFTYGGMQDLANAGRNASLAEFDWAFSSAGDGDFVAVDPGNPNIAHAFQNDIYAWTPNGGVSWFTENNPLLSERPVITQVLNTNPVQVVTLGHPFQTGDTVVAAGVPGGGGLANGANVVTRVDNFIFTLNGKNGVAAPAFTPGPLITGGQCATSRAIAAVGPTAPIEVRTSTEHGFATGDQVHIEAVVGPTVANNTAAKPFWTITVTSPTQFSLDPDTNATVAPPHVPGTGRVVGPRRVVSVPIKLVTQATPIVVTAFRHGFVTGDAVTVANVLGTTAANNTAANPNWTITVIDTNSVILIGSVGNAPFILGPRAAGPSIGRGMGAANAVHRIAVVPDPAHPLMFVSRLHHLLSSVDGGVHFNNVAGTPWSAANERVMAIAAPDANRLWIATRVFNNAGKPRPSRVYFRGQVNPGDPLTWFGAAQNFVNDPGSLGIIWGIAVDPNNSQNVAVVASGFSETHIRRRTRHCFVTTTGGRTVGATRAWTEAGGVFDAASGNLPDFPILSVAWLPDADPAKPSTLLVASEAGVLRLNGNQWERFGPNLPNVSCQKLRIDTTAVPPVVRLGTYGRSAWELVRPTGPRLIVRSRLGFGERLVGSDTRLPILLCSAGDAPVHIESINAFGAFSVDPPTAPGFDIPAGETKALNILFHPAAAGFTGIQLDILSNDPNGLITVFADGIGVTAGKGRLSVRRRVDFGIVANGAVVTVPLEIANTGQGTLNLTTLALDAAGTATITLPGAPVVDAAHPFVIAPGEVKTVNVQFAPTANGNANRVLHIGPPPPPPPAPPPPLTDVRISGTAVAAGAPNLLASVVHFMGLDNGEESASEAIA